MRASRFGAEDVGICFLHLACEGGIKSAFLQRLLGLIAFIDGCVSMKLYGRERKLSHIVLSYRAIEDKSVDLNVVK